MKRLQLFFSTMELTIGSLHLTEIQKIIKGELKNKSGIYAFLCKTSNDLYIGSSIQLSSRFNDHITGYNSNIKLQNAINKYSLENFIFIILEYCEPEKLISQEQFYFNIIKPDYNINLIAGSRLGSTHSEESIAKMSEAKSDMNNPMFNKTHSEETKALMSFAQSGDKHPMFGKIHSKESIALMSQVHLGKTHTVETKVKIALSLGKKVYLYDKDNLNIFFKEFISYREAAKYLKCDKNTVNNYIDTNKIFKNKWVIYSIKYEQSCISNKDNINESNEE